jgi:hypothetical protein
MKIRLAIYDVHVERQGGAPKKVADVVAEGGNGKLVVHDPALAPVLRDLFEKPASRMVGGGGGDAPATVLPFTQASLDHAVKHGLPAWNLRAVVVAEAARRGG